MFDLENISLKNKKAWSLIQSGNTCGVFQLESELGKQWAKTIRPSNINELSALLALIRPACLESGMTSQYSRIKNGKEPPFKFGDEDVDRILNPTNGVLIYQEQLMKFGGEIAWKHFEHLDRLVIVDKLRKGIGKKNAKLISDLKQKFIDGCVHNGRTVDFSEKLFDIIEKAGRYAFNDAHAKKYALWSYRTAYAKANFPLEFYCTYLTYSRLRQKPKEEIRNLVNEARMLSIKIDAPSLKNLTEEFQISEDKKSIHFGLSHIKQVSHNDLKVLNDNQEMLSSLGDFFKLHFDKVGFDKRIRSACVESLIKSGSCDFFGLSRSSMLEGFSVLRGLTPRECIYVCDRMSSCNLKEIKNLIKDCAKNFSSEQRRSMLISEAESIDVSRKDSRNKNLMLEKDLIGVEFSMIFDKGKRAKLTCKECYKFSKENRGHKGSVLVKISEVIPLVTKRGQNAGSEMCQIIATDNSGSYRFACFPDNYKKFKNLIEENVDCVIEVDGTGNGWCVNSLNHV